MRASSLRRSSESDTFERQQAALVVEPKRSVRAQAIRGDDAVTRHDDREAVPCAERAHSTLRARMTGEPGEVCVRDDLAVRDTPQGAKDVELERGPTLRVHFDVAKVGPSALEVGRELVGEVFRLRRCSATDTCAFPPYRRPRGWWAVPPTLGGGYTRAPARTHACT